MVDLGGAPGVEDRDPGRRYPRAWLNPKVEPDRLAGAEIPAAYFDNVREMVVGEPEDFVNPAPFPLTMDEHIGGGPAENPTGPSLVRLHNEPKWGIANRPAKVSGDGGWLGA
ncbi:MAG: hypothetical protein ACR2JC_01595 [Chloroflexota bacterium]|nr:MAG: hypothetical protein DLM70_04650 [Chloroflexota bacterium]